MVCSEACHRLRVNGPIELPMGQEDLFFDSEVQRPLRPELEESRRSSFYVFSAAQIPANRQSPVVVSRE